MELKVDDVYFTPCGAFVKIISIKDNIITYGMRHHGDTNSNYVICSDSIESELFSYFISSIGYIKYSEAARILYGRF